MENYFIFLTGVGLGTLIGIIITYLLCYFPIKTVKLQLNKLRSQVYYWSRQMPVKKNK